MATPVSAAAGRADTPMLLLPVHKTLSSSLRPARATFPLDTPSCVVHALPAPEIIIRRVLQQTDRFERVGPDIGVQAVRGRMAMALTRFQ